MNRIKITFGFILNHPLGKKHPVKALMRFLFWQIQSTLQPSKFIVKHYLSEIHFYARKRLTGITGNIYTGLHEFEDMAFLLHFLTAADTFFDIGANVGSYTLLASGVCKAKTIAIEASVNTAAITNKNISLNKLENSVTLINAAAGAEPGELLFSKNQDTTNHIINRDSSENTDTGELVKVIMMDSLTSKPTLIKIDVEGFETEVLRGMKVTLKQSSLKAIIIELNGSGANYGFNEQDIHQTLLANGFKPYQYNPFKRTLNLMPSFGGFNTIYCRDLEFINSRLKAADSFKIMGETI